MNNLPVFEASFVLATLAQSELLERSQNKTLNSTSKVNTSVNRSKSESNVDSIRRSEQIAEMSSDFYVNKGI